MFAPMPTDAIWSPGTRQLNQSHTKISAVGDEVAPSRPGMSAPMPVSRVSPAHEPQAEGDDEEDGPAELQVGEAWKASPGDGADDERQEDRAKKHRPRPARASPSRPGGMPPVAAAPSATRGRAVEHRRQLVVAIGRPIEDAAVEVHEDGHDVGVELDAGEALELLDRLLVGERRLAVRARAGHRLVGIGDGEDPGAERDVEGLDAVRVAGAVEPLVVRLDERRLAVASCDAGATISAPMVGCWFMRIRSCLSSGPSFSRMLSRMPILPMSWSSPAHLIFSISAPAAASRGTSPRRCGSPGSSGCGCRGPARPPPSTAPRSSARRALASRRTARRPAAS